MDRGSPRGRDVERTGEDKNYSQERGNDGYSPRNDRDAEKAHDDGHNLDQEHQDAGANEFYDKDAKDQQEGAADDQNGAKGGDANHPEESYANNYKDEEGGQAGDAGPGQAQATEAANGNEAPKVDQELQDAA